MPRLPQPWDLRDVLGVGTCFLAHLAWGHTDLWWFGRIRAGHDVPDFQCRHVFWYSNSWTALAGVPPRELHWSQHTNWRLGWCRKLQAPVLIKCCGCCPVVAGWCLMLCHTRHNHSPAWSEQWPSTASTVCLGPLLTSSAQPLEGDSGPPCTLSLTHWCVSWKRVLTQPKELCWVLNRQECVTNPDCRRSRNLGSGCSEMYDFTLMGCKPEAIPRCPFLYDLYSLL